MMTELLKHFESQEIEVVLWFRKGETLRGIPKYRGFDIDTGELFEVASRVVATHDFRSIVIVNPDNPLVQEHVA